MSADALLTMVANAVAIAAVYCRSAVTLLTGAWPITNGAVPISADAPPMSAKAAPITADVGRLWGGGGAGGGRGGQGQTPRQSSCQQHSSQEVTA